MKKLTMTLDFSKCKTVRDVDKVWKENMPFIRTIKKFIKSVAKPRT